jgi:hypothetical protein
LNFVARKELVKPHSSLKLVRSSLRDRQFGSEFNQWELKLLKDFSLAKQSKKPKISGVLIYDSKLGKNRFILIPAAHLAQDYVICECPPYMHIPSNLSNVTIEGQRRVFADHWEILVEKCILDNPKLPLKPEINFKEFRDILFSSWGGIDSLFKDLLALQFVSSPPIIDLGVTGGLNFTVYDNTNRRESKKLLSYFRGILPVDIAFGKSGNLSLPELATEQPLSPFSFKFKSFDADKPLTQNLLTFLETRKSVKYPELSIGLGSRKSCPISIYDPPLTMVDQPTLLPDSAEMMKVSADPPLDVIKYIITMQMRHPTLGRTEDDLDKMLAIISNSVIEVAEKYDIPQTVRRHGLFDPNYYGKPQSILRLGLATARADGKQMTDTEELTKLFYSFFMKNMEAVMESWDDLFTVKGVEMASLDESDRRILKFISSNETEFGVGFYLLSERFASNKFDEFKIRQRLDILKDMGRICETKFNVFKSIPFE